MRGFYLKPQFSLFMPELIKIKRNHLNPIGSAKALPFGGQRVLEEKKAYPRVVF